MRRWPDSLPTPSYPGFGLRPAENTIRTAFTVGEARVRQITDAQIDMLTMSWIFTDAEMRLFRNFAHNRVVTDAGDSDDLTGWFDGLMNENLAPILGPDDCVPTRLTPTASYGWHWIRKSLPGLAVNGLPIALTVSMAPAGYTKTRLHFVDRSGAAVWADVDLSTGQVIATSGMTVTLKDRGDGFWRISASVNAGTGILDPVLWIFVLNASGQQAYTADGTSSIDVCEGMVRSIDLVGDTLFCRAGADNKALGAGGGAWFLIPAPVGGGFLWQECRFVQMFEARAGNNLEWNVTAQVEVRNA